MPMNGVIGWRRRCSRNRAPLGMVWFMAEVWVFAGILSYSRSNRYWHNMIYAPSSPRKKLQRAGAVQDALRVSEIVVPSAAVLDGGSPLTLFHRVTATVPRLIGNAITCVFEKSNSQIIEQSGSFVGRKFFQLRRERINFRFLHQFNFAGQQRGRRAAENRRHRYGKSQRVLEAGQYLRCAQRITA